MFTHTPRQRHCLYSAGYSELKRDKNNTLGALSLHRIMNDFFQLNNHQFGIVCCSLLNKATLCGFRGSSPKWSPLHCQHHTYDTATTSARVCAVETVHNSRKTLSLTMLWSKNFTLQIFEL